MAGLRQVVASVVRGHIAVCGSVALGLLLAMAAAGWAACDPRPVCGNGIREVGEQCDGGSFCADNCTLLGIAPGCCVGGTTQGCADASGWSLNYYMYSYCLSLGGATNVVGGVCSQGSCSVLSLAAPVPLCCASNTDGSCTFSETENNTAGLWHFFNYCEGATMRTYHTVPAATCGPAGVCVPQ